MNLEEYLRNRLKKRPLLLMTHAVVGYPSLEDNWEMLQIMHKEGVDLIELQLPFSEPIADGPLFLKANQHALQNGIRQGQYFELMQRASERFDFPILMMGYYNSAFVLGHRPFCETLAQAGGKGFILPDLPIEEYADLLDIADNMQLAPVQLCTPTNTPERIEKIVAQGRGFIYCVARKGVTGTRTVLDQATYEFIQLCRKATTLPLALGFGLTRGEDLDDLHGKVEIAIVGTALLKSWENGGAKEYTRHLRELIHHCG